MYQAQDESQLTQLIQDIQKENSALHQQVSIVNDHCDKLETELKNVKGIIQEMRAAPRP